MALAHVYVASVLRFVPAGLIERPVVRRGRRTAYAWKAAYRCPESGVHTMTRAEATLFARANGARASFPRS